MANSPKKVCEGGKSVLHEEDWVCEGAKSELHEEDWVCEGGKSELHEEYNSDYSLYSSRYTRVVCFGNPATLRNASWCLF